MMKPTIHLNGTGHDDLLKQAETVYRAAGELLDALSNACPNGRDYYPQGDNAIHTAIQEHSERMVAVEKIRDDMLALADNVYENRPKKKG
jgi:hypothetical protein